MHEQDTDEARNVARFWVDGSYGYDVGSEEILWETFIKDRKELEDRIVDQVGKKGHDALDGIP